MRVEYTNSGWKYWLANFCEFLTFDTPKYLMTVDGKYYSLKEIKGSQSGSTDRDAYTGESLARFIGLSWAARHLSGSFRARYTKNVTELKIGEFETFFAELKNETLLSDAIKTSHVALSYLAGSTSDSSSAFANLKVKEELLKHIEEDPDEYVKACVENKTLKEKLMPLLNKENDKEKYKNILTVVLKYSPSKTALFGFLKECLASCEEGQADCLMNFTLKNWHNVCDTRDEFVEFLQEVSQNATYDLIHQYILYYLLANSNDSKIVDNLVKCAPKDLKHGKDLYLERCKKQDHLSTEQFQQFCISYLSSMGDESLRKKIILEGGRVIKDEERLEKFLLSGYQKATHEIEVKTIEEAIWHQVGKKALHAEEGVGKKASVIIKCLMGEKKVDLMLPLLKNLDAYEDSDVQAILKQCCQKYQFSQILPKIISGFFEKGVVHILKNCIACVEDHDGVGKRQILTCLSQEITDKSLYEEVLEAYDSRFKDSERILCDELVSDFEQARDDLEARLTVLEIGKKELEANIPYLEHFLKKCLEIGGGTREVRSGVKTIIKHHTQLLGVVRNLLACTPLNDPSMAGKTGLVQLVKQRIKARKEEQEKRGGGNDQQFEKEYTNLLFLAFTKTTEKKLQEEIIKYTGREINEEALLFDSLYRYFQCVDTEKMRHYIVKYASIDTPRSVELFAKPIAEEMMQKKKNLSHQEREMLEILRNTLRDGTLKEDIIAYLGNPSPPPSK